MDQQQQLNIINEQVKNDTGKKLLYIVPESAGDIFLATSLLMSMHSLYPEFKIYFACKTEYKELLKNNPYIHKVLDYMPIMESAAHMEGIGDWKGLFDISIIGTVLTQRHINYWHNGLSRLAFDIKE